MAAARNDDTVSTASTSSRVSHFGLNQCPRSDRLRAMRNDIAAELEGCRRLFNAVIACAEGTNDFDDAACESDGARHGLRDMVYDFISYARQMALDQPNKVISLSRTRIKLGAKNISQPREKPPWETRYWLLPWKRWLQLVRLTFPPLSKREEVAPARLLSPLLHRRYETSALPLNSSHFSHLFFLASEFFGRQNTAS